MKRTGNQNFYFTAVEDPIRSDLKNSWIVKDNSLELESKEYIDILKQTIDKTNFYIPTNFLDPDTVNKIKNSSNVYIDFNFDIASPYLIKNKELSTLYNVSNATKVELKTKYNFYNSYYESFVKRDDIDELDLLNYYILLAKDIRQNDDIENIVTNGKRIDDADLEKNFSDRYVTNYANTFDDWKQEFKKYKKKLVNIAFNPADVPVNENRSSLFPNLINVEFVKEKSGEFSKAFKDTYFNLNILSNNVFLGTNQNPNRELKFNILKRKLSNLLLDTGSLNGSIESKYYESVGIKFYDYTRWLERTIENNDDFGAKYFDFQNNRLPCYFIGNTTNQQVPSTDDNLFLFNLMSRVLLGKTNYIVKENFRNFKEVLSGKECYTEPIGLKIEKFKTNVGVIQTYYIENTEEDILNFIDTQLKTDQEYSYRFSYYLLVIGNAYSYNLIARSKSVTNDANSAAGTNAVLSRDLSQQLSPDNNIDISKLNIDQSVINFSSKINLSDTEIKLSQPILNRTSLYMQQRPAQPTGSLQIPFPIQPINALLEPVSAPSENNSGILLVQNTPLVYVFEIPVFSDNDVFTDIPKSKPKISKPPVSPLVEPIPYKDLKDKIKFNFQRSLDTLSEKFVILEDSDVVLLENMASAQQKNVDEKLVFGDDEPIKQIRGEENKPFTFFENYEIFRIDTKPFSYEDFRNKKYKTINNDSFIDTLEYNKKYYYLFRAVDAAGYKSNPTIIYEIEIIENSDIYYPIIKVFEFEKFSGVSTNKTLNRYLYVNVSYNQMLNNSSAASAYEQAPNFGIGPSVWNKNYKIRLTSKQTGRKLDINFKMQYNQDTNNIIRNTRNAIRPNRPISTPPQTDAAPTSVNRPIRNDINRNKGN